jgi:hypothetical protein
MRAKKTLLTLTIVGLMALFLCLPASVFAGPGPNSSSVPTGYKKSGPSPAAFLLAGWRPNLDEFGEETGFGVLEVYIWVGAKLYIGIIQLDQPESAWTTPPTTATDLVITVDENDDISGWIFPSQIADEYKMPPDAVVVVLEEKDISDYELLLNVTTDDLAIDVSGGTIPLGFKHLLSCNVRLTFLIPQ